MKEYLIVDGYNVIFAWPELKKIASSSLEHARLDLQRMLQNYARYKGFNEVVLVFDGKKSKAESTEERISKDFLIVYTDDLETADSYIERMVHAREGRFTNIYVVTSDGAEQHQILGSGGLRIPVRELRADVYKAKKEEQDHYDTKAIPIIRNNLGSLVVDEEIVRKLEALRLNKLEED